MSRRPKTINVLLIENDTGIINSLIEFTDTEGTKSYPQINFVFTVAKNVETATRELTDGTKRFNAIISDMVLPINYDSQLKLEQLDAKRKQLQLKQVLLQKKDRNKYSAEVSRLRRELNEIDDKIDMNLDIEGGYNVLNEYLKSKGISCFDRPVIVLTASANLDLKERFKKLVNIDKYIWMEKPVPENELFLGVISFFGIK